MDKKSQTDKQREIFDRQILEDIGSTTQIDTIKLDNWMQSYLNRIFKTLQDAGINKSGKILDIGCGAFGWVPITAVKNGYSFACGLEISLKACQYADSFSKKSLAKKLPFYIQNSADSLCFKDESFDVVTCIAVLEHIMDDDSAITEMARVVKKNGIVYIVVPNDYRKIPFFLRWYYKRVDKKWGIYVIIAGVSLQKNCISRAFKKLDFTLLGTSLKCFNTCFLILFRY